MYEYIIKIPDQGEDRDIEVGYCYTPLYYDATVHDGEYIPGQTPVDEGLAFCLGEPYMRATDQAYSASWIEAVFIFADEDGNDCATYDEMINIYNWAS